MNQDLVKAIQQLVDSVFIEHCLPVDGDEAPMNEQQTVECAHAVLRKIRAAPELASLHKWADRLLLNPCPPEITEYLDHRNLFGSKH
jgi:hypothetical protein